MKLPDKIISGDSYQDVRRKINAICDYLRSVRPVAGPNSFFAGGQQDGIQG